MLLAASSSMPDKFGLSLLVTASGKNVMSLKGTFDNASEVAYLEIKGDPAAFGEQAATAGAFLEEGLSIYTSKEGSFYLSNKTAFVFPPSSEETTGGFIPSPEDGPLAAYTNPTTVLGNFANDEVQVKTVTPTVFRGRPAVDLLVTTMQDNESVDATVTLFTDPPRLAQIKTTLPRDADNPQSPLSSANALAEFFYDDEVTLAIPQAAARSVGLAYKSESSQSGTTWSFLGSAGIALSEVEAHVKDGSSAGEGASGMTDIAGLPTLWTMKLSEGSATKNGVTITFTDADSDGKVSKGDSLTYVVGEDAEGSPSVILFDNVTGTYVVPGFGFVALVLGALVVALVLRRKAR